MILNNQTDERSYPMPVLYFELENAQPRLNTHTWAATDGLNAYIQSTRTSLCGVVNVDSGTHPKISTSFQH